MNRIVYTAISAFLLVGCFSIETSAQGPRAEELTITSEVFAPGDQEFPPPDQRYIDEDGTLYYLDSWQTVELPDEKTEKLVESEVIYVQMEYTDSIPQTTEISIYNEYTGEKITSALPLQEMECIEESWEEGLELPVTYHDYHSDAYQLGEYLITPDQEKPKLDGYEGVLLAMAGLPESDYRITNIQWDGEPYQDENGQWCRDAAASGEKRLCGYRVKYGGSVVLTKPGGLQWKAVYRSAEEPRTVPDNTVIETESAAAKAPEVQTSSSWKTWIKTTVVVTIAIGLLLLLIFCFFYLACWIKKKEKHRSVGK